RIRPSRLHCPSARGPREGCVMRVAAWHRAALACVAACCLLPAAFPRADEQAAKWKLVWSDEFDGKDIDRTKWDHDVGNGFSHYEANVWTSGWGNNELQYYTREADNSFVKDGMLHVRALKESLHGCGYTSARLKTRKRDGTALYAKKYGRFEVRAKC